VKPGQKVLSTIARDPHLWIALVAAAAFLLMDIGDLVHWSPSAPPPKGVLVVIMLCIVMIVADRLKHSEQVRDNAKRLERLASAIYDDRVALQKRPMNGEDAQKMWAGFTGRYAAYNPSYRLQSLVGDDHVYAILVDRFRDPRFEHARYIFLTGDDLGRRDLQNFVTLMKRVRTQCPEVAATVQVRVIRDKTATSDAEMYLGIQDRRLVCILEPREPALGPTHGAPHYYLIIHKKKVIEDHLQTYFDNAWEAASEVDIFDEATMNELLAPRAD
jgi:hypothetical protein